MSFSANNYLSTGMRAQGGQDPLEAACPPSAGLWHGFQPFGALCGRYHGQGTANGRFDTRNWVITRVEAGGSESTLTVTDACPPLLLVTTDSNESDGINAQWTNGSNNDDQSTLAVSEVFKYAAGRNIYFEARLKMSDELQSKGEIGLCITDTTLNGGMTDGMYFRKKDGDATWFFVLEKNSTETETELTTALGSTEIAADTFITIGFRFNAGATAATSSIDVFVNGRRINTAIAMTNFCDDEELALSFDFLAGEAVSKTMSISHIVAYQEAI